MQITKWMAVLAFGGSLFSGAALAVEVDSAQNQAAVKESAAMDKPAATLGGQMDDCPMHKSGKDMAQGMGKDGDHCQCPHDKMHKAHMEHMSAVQGKCELHNKEKCAEEKDCMAKHVEKCQFKHDTKHKMSHEACDPVKDAAKMSKLSK